MLTETERLTIRTLGNVWNAICVIVEDGPSRDSDLNEAVLHIHALQHMIMANAAARAFPAGFRRLGAVIEP